MLLEKLYRVLLIKGKHHSEMQYLLFEGKQARKYMILRNPVKWIPFRYFPSAEKKGWSDEFQGGFSFWNEAVWNPQSNSSIPFLQFCNERLTEPKHLIKTHTLNIQPSCPIQLSSVYHYGAKSNWRLIMFPCHIGIMMTSWYPLVNTVHVNKL